MGLTDKLKGIKKDDVDNINSQAGKYAGGKDGQTGTDLAQDKYKQYKAGKLLIVQRFIDWSKPRSQ